jgi:hypothetical protein
MSRRSAASALVCGLALVGLLGLGSCKTGTKAAENGGPFLSILQPDGPTDVRTTVTPASVALALGGLPLEELPRLREHLAESTEGVLRRAAPELFDLEERSGDAGADPLRQMLPDLPALTAAANLLGSPWEGPGISVHLGPVCEAAASRCTPVFVSVATADEPLVRRGRALAWALGNAALLRVPASAREGLLHSLREAQLRPSGSVAMVFASARGTIDAAELDRLRHEARQALAQLRPDAPQRPWLDALDAARIEWELPVALKADQVLVIPRLSALARLQDFVAEVESARTFEWVVRPGGR